MTVKSSMQYKWRNKTESGTRIEDIFDCPDPDALAPAILASSFILPAAMLNNQRYAISPIYVIPGHKLPDFARIIPIETQLFSDVERSLLVYAKGVGISMRIDLFTKKVYCVLKLWYGKSPWLEKDDTLDTIIRHDRVIKMANKLFN